MIDVTFGAPGGATYVSPEGKLYIKGEGFGTMKGRILLYGVGFPKGSSLELNPVDWESDSQVNGRVPLVTGIKTSWRTYC